MIISSPQEAQIQIRFFEDIYKPKIEKLPLLRDVDIDHGRRVLNTEAECDKYIALYGGHHFHKLYAAFPSTNFHYTEGKSVEIIDWGCGQALASCVLIDYLIEKRISPKIESITLIEPSSIALWRGYSFVRQILQPAFSNNSRIQTVNKCIDNLNCSDFVSSYKNIKIHLFSNILDVEDFDLNKLYQLIINSFSGFNRIICTSPYNNKRNYRIDSFYQLFNEHTIVKNSFYSDEAISQEIFYNNTGKFKLSRIQRYERQFLIKI
ncbi:hypothetical protein [Nostoc sp. DedQUE07]|uniref:hypothetical protein n=1 Tax=Nostoc sp. DedQUE07 TaxID=3075392 RepID=UPI002AD2180B|nr:hypothetical protein [Nostoc sp. DedQUE07]MDZ8133493.1 hypothetical protein [Nostoc sp. DedQUE07]